MKKRSACKILSGLVALGALHTGQCGQITLHGAVRESRTITVDVTGLSPNETRLPYDIATGCALCMKHDGPCVNAPPRNVRVVHRMNIKDATLSKFGVTMGTLIEWRVAHPELNNNIQFVFECDNQSRPDWPYIGAKLYRKARTVVWPMERMRVTATDMATGITGTREWGPGDDTAWSPAWGWVNDWGGTGGSATVRISYPENVELRGPRAQARILYDIAGTAPVSARIDRMPDGLSCARSSDGLRIMSGVSTTVGTGDSIMCTNVLDRLGTTSDSLSVAVMIR